MKNSNQLDRQSIRLKGYDYSLPGYYFVTICSYQRQCSFGSIKKQTVKLSAEGKIIKDFLPQIKKHFPHVEIGEFVIMPNHLHLIIKINETLRVGQPFRRGAVAAPVQIRQSAMALSGGVTPPLQNAGLINGRPTLGQIIGYLKYQTTKIINLAENLPGQKIWQRNYFEHIIRNQEEYEKIRLYIKTNPERWDEDRNNPENIDIKKNTA